VPPSEPSRTMVQTAIVRAAHQVLDRPLILEDPLAVGLVPEASEQAILATETDHRSVANTRRRAAVVLRSRFAEDRLADAVERGVSQYVIAAAGLDTFPWRQPDFARKIHIYFADLPGSLIWVRARLRQRGLSQPSNLTFVPVDLERRDIGCQLVKFGFDPRAPTFCSALGIVQFLTAGAVDALLQFAAEARHQSEIVLSFTPPDDELGPKEIAGLKLSLERGENFGERWLTRLRAAELVERFERFGFRKIVHLTPEMAQQRYFGDRTDALSAPRTGQVIAAII